MEQPSWYKDTEAWLMAHGGRQAVTLALVAIILVCGWFLWEMWTKDAKVLPAAAFATYMWMP